MSEESDPFSLFGGVEESGFAQFQEVDYAGLLNNKQLSDVAFVVEGNRFYAHKSILCSRSKYFDKLLRGTFKQFNGMELEIEIRDSPLMFYKVLQFIYTGSVGDLKTLDEYVILGLLSCSVIYELEALQVQLENHIAENHLTVTNVCTIWRLALETGSNTLAQKCEEYFRTYSSKITQLPDFSEQMWEPIDLDSFITEVDSQVPPESEYLVQSFLGQEEEKLHEAKRTRTPQEFEKGQLFQSAPQPQLQYQVYNNTVPLKQESAQVRSNMIGAQAMEQAQQKATFGVKTEMGAPANGGKGGSTNWINVYPLDQGMPAPKQPPLGFSQSALVPNPSESSHQLSLDDNRPPPPSYKTLAGKQKRLPMLQGPIWAKALEKMHTLIDLSRDLIGADIGTLFLHDPITNELYSHVAHPEPVDIALPATLGIAGACFTTNKCINSPSAYTDTRFYSGIDRQTGAPTLAILAVPVPSESGKILGVIELLNKKRTTEFSEENEREVRTAARMIGKIVEKATLEVKTDIEKKGLKRIHMFSNMDETRTKRPRARRRDSIPVFHFKQVNS